MKEDLKNYPDIAEQLIIACQLAIDRRFERTGQRGKYPTGEEMFYWWINHDKSKKKKEKKMDNIFEAEKSPSTTREETTIHDFQSQPENRIEKATVEKEKELVKKMFDYKENLSRYIAGGRPSEDTLDHYNLEIENFLKWCSANAYDPIKDIQEQEAFQYLDYLNKQNYSAASVNLKICAARTFYFVACKLRKADENPFEAVKPKKPAYDDAEFDYFDIDELKQICDSIIKRKDPTAQRDLAIVMLMAVEGLRTVEVHRMSDEDFNFKNNSILIHGKGRDNYIYPCQDTLKVLETYLNSRPEPVKDEQGTPTFIGFSPKFFGVRISRNGIRWAINHILLSVDKKKKGSSCHTLRHSCGTNLYAETKDLRLVQETLRQKDPQTAARYAHVNERIAERQTSFISPLKSSQNPLQGND